MEKEIENITNMLLGTNREDIVLAIGIINNNEELAKIFKTNYTFPNNFENPFKNQILKIFYNPNWTFNKNSNLYLEINGTILYWEKPLLDRYWM